MVGGCIAVFNINALAEYVQGAPAFSAICHPLSAEQNGTPNCEAVTDLAAGSYVEAAHPVKYHWITSGSFIQLQKIRIT
ncbi:hypothetical protein F4815DRAFT_445730 [Daldinia loculata]|nr:hypothetical protein F4815DRAFT_445730 [Daldinia loculata]